MRILTVFLLMHLSAVPDTFIEKIRADFFSIHSVEQADDYIRSLESSEKSEAKAYIAALTLMKAKFYKFPLKKLKYFKRGKTALEEQIKKEPYNIELRYIRYIMQVNIPDFLAYNGDLEADLSFIMEQLPEAELELSIKQLIIRNIIQMNQLTATELVVLENSLN